MSTGPCRRKSSRRVGEQDGHFLERRMQVHNTTHTVKRNKKINKFMSILLNFNLGFISLCTALHLLRAHPKQSMYVNSENVESIEAKVLIRHTYCRSTVFTTGEATVLLSLLE